MKLFILKIKYKYAIYNITIFCYSYMFLRVILPSKGNPHNKFKNCQNIANQRSNTNYIYIYIYISFHELPKNGRILCRNVQEKPKIVILCISCLYLFGSLNEQNYRQASFLGWRLNSVQWTIRRRFKNQLRKTLVFIPKIRAEEVKVMYPRRNLCVPSGNHSTN